MPASYVIASQIGGASFASQIDVTMDLGTGSDRFIMVLIWASSSGANGLDGFIDNCVIDPSGSNVSVPEETADVDASSIWSGYNGRVACFTLSGATIPTGSKVVRVNFDNGDSRVGGVVYVGRGTPGSGTWFSVGADPLSTCLLYTSPSPRDH
jgi:hypothetical protein